MKYVKPVGKKQVTPMIEKWKGEFVGDLFVDKIKSVEKMSLDEEVPVYDLSIPGTQNFIGGFGGILLHNTGHPSLATIHAATIPQLIDRLITPPISLPPSLIENLDIIIFLSFSRLREAYVRRADNILEVVGLRGDRPETARVFEWRPITDTFEITAKSVVLKKISKRMGVTEESIQYELVRRKKVLEWMLEKEIFDYKDVAKVISTYYSDPERVMDSVEAG